MMNILVMFGGISAEHEVSVISGLQVLESIDRNKYTTHPIYQTRDGEFLLLPKITTRKDFRPRNGVVVSFGRDKKGPFIRKAGIGGRKIYIYASFMAFHGGPGEDGRIQGLLESLELPHTSPSAESSAITMNKSLTKEVFLQNNLPALKSVSFTDEDVKLNLERSSKNAMKELSLPIIVKPSHLGSSIGINIAKDETELQRFMLSAAMIDKEILLEKCISNFKEYNCAVRKVNGQIEVSQIEKPLGKDEILSFADKYQRGGKKTGGMASSSREIPAKISDQLRDSIVATAKKAYSACRCESMVRIDFMYHENELFITEINSIPGSLAFYLWEASGITFRQQITDLIEQAVIDSEDNRKKRLEYKTDIIQKFVSGN